MPDQVLKLRIEGDASGATAALETTNKNVQQLKIGLDGAGESGVNMGKRLAESGEATEYSMMEARHAIMMVGEELGVHVPRAVSGMIAEIGPLGAVMAAAFPILGALALIEVIAKVVEHFEAAKEAVAKFNQEEQDLQNKTNLTTQALALQNLKLDDQIAKLEGGTGRNDLAERLLEANKAAGELAAGLDKDAENVRKLTQDTSFLEKAKEVFLTLTDMTGVYAEDFYKVDDALGTVRNSIAEVAAAEAKMDSSPSAANREAYKQALIDSNRVLNQSIETIRDYGDASGHSAATIDALTKKIQEQSSIVEQLGLLQQKQAEEERIQADERRKQANEAASQQINDAKTIADETVAVEESAYKAQQAALDTNNANKLANLAGEMQQEKTFADERLANEQAAIQAQLALHKSASDEDKRERERLNTELESAELKHQEALSQIDATFAAKRIEEEKAQAEAAARALEQLNKSTEELAQANNQLVASQDKLKEAQETESNDAAVAAIKQRVAARTETESAANAQITALFQKEADAKIAIEQNLIATLEAEQQQLQSALAAAQATGDATQINQAQAKLDKLVAQENDAQAKIIAIRTQAANQIAAVAIKQENSEENAVNQYVQKATTEFGQLYANVLQGHETIAKAAVQTYNKMESAFVSYLTRSLAQAIAAHTAHMALNQGEKMSAAETAAAKAGQSVADIPFIGAFLAPVAAATVFAALSAFDTGGMVDGTQLALVHDHEAVLTPQQTETLKAAADNGGISASSGDTHYHTHNWNAIDGASVATFFRRNSDKFGDAMNHAVRNGHFDTASAVRGK